MRVRSKISYSAFIRKMTIVELFFQTILYSLGMITLTHSVEKPLVYPKETCEKFEQIMRSDLGDVFK